MVKNFQRPKIEAELKAREAAGLWRAQALAKQIGESSEKITIDVILRIHRVFFEHTNPDMAGRFRKRGEDINKLKYIVPPPGIVIQEKMYEFWRELDTKLAQVPPLPKIGGKKTLERAMKMRNEIVIDIAAWTQHKIVSIHPFCEGNGRMARLMTNLILYRHKLQPTDIKYEGEDKRAYIDALGAIDTKNDFRPLKHLITKGIVDSYKKLVETQKKSNNKI